MNIEEFLKPNPEFIDKYQFMNSRGKEYLLDKRVAVIGLARNLSSVIEHNVSKIINFVSNAKDYRIFIFENDSIDDTKNIIESLSKNNSKINYQFETFNRRQYGTTKEKERTTALAEYRNIAKDWLKSNYSDYDYVVVLDFDFNDFSIDGCYNTFGHFSNDISIDAIAGNSFEIKKISNREQYFLWNYDSWAFRYNWWEDQHRFINFYTHDPMLWFGYWTPPVGSDIIKVNSAFGGMTIYKVNKFLSGNYEGYDCEHVCFHKNLSKNSDGFNLYLNPSQRMLMR